ncbi:aminotransferase [Phlyctema vagabunda]|uniref:Aminotransferase n=1 Tax=Phlyctema vagabunda TaxID=108571 RepID=A0ABR4P8I3_9HELO
MSLTLINLQLGWPSKDLLPAAALSDAAVTCLADPEIATPALLYGPGLGNNALRLAIAEWLTSAYKPIPGIISPDRICVSGGASQNVVNILQVYTDPSYTRGVWMIEPTYHLASKIFEDAGFQGKLRGVPEDDEGCDIDFFRTRITEVEKERKSKSDKDVPSFKTGPLWPKIYKHVIYCVPTFSNPSAKTMSLRRRKQLVLLAREFDALLITDDCYDFLRWPQDDNTSPDELGPIPPRLVDIDRELPGGSKWGNTISNGTFSKLIGPGIRVGWAEASETFAQGLVSLGATRSGGNPSQFTSTFVAHLLQTGFLQKHIKDVLSPTYRNRYRSLMGAISKYLEPLNAQVTIGTNYSTTLNRNLTNPQFVNEKQESQNTVEPPVAGGFFTYITLPSDLPDTKILAARAFEEYNLRVAYGEIFEVRGDEQSGKRPGREFDHSLRLCWAWEKDEVLQAGIQRLAALIKTIRREQSKK